MSRTRPARSEKSAASSSWRPNSFTSSAPATLNRSVIVLFIEALRFIPSRVMACRPRPTRRAGSTNTGRITTASKVSRHSSPSHDDQGPDQGDDVGHHRAERAGEGPLGSDHVVVEPANEGAGLGAGEEGQRHALHVVEQPQPQVEDQALADAGAEPALHQRQQRLARGRGDQHDEQQVQVAAVALCDGRVEDLPDHQRRQQPQERRGDDDDDERDDPGAVGPGETPHPAPGVGGDRLALETRSDRPTWSASRGTGSPSQPSLRSTLPVASGSWIEAPLWP